MTDLHQITNPTGVSTGAGVTATLPLQHHNMAMYVGGGNGVSRIPIKQRRHSKSGTDKPANSNDEQEEEYVASQSQQLHSTAKENPESTDNSVRHVDNRNDTVDTSDSTAATEEYGGESDNYEKAVSRTSEGQGYDRPTYHHQNSALPTANQHVIANKPITGQHNKNRTAENIVETSETPTLQTKDIVHNNVQSQNNGQTSNPASRDIHDGKPSTQTTSATQQIHFRTILTQSHHTGTDRPENGHVKYNFATQNGTESAQFSKHPQTNPSIPPHQSGQQSQQQFSAGGKSQYRSIATSPNISVSKGKLSPNGVHNREGTIDATPPLFERLFTSEETQDAKTYSRIIGNQNRRYVVFNIYF